MVSSQSDGTSSTPGWVISLDDKFYADFLSTVRLMSENLDHMDLSMQKGIFFLS